MIRRFIVLAAVTLPLFVQSALSVESALACPRVAKLPDLNCDGKFSLVLLGDSIAAGQGDTDADKGLKGYLARAQRRFPEAEFSSFAVSGQTTLQGLKQLNDAFKEEPEDSKLHQALLAADLVVIDTGRNDRWLFGPPIASFRNLKRIRTVIEKRVGTATGVTPVVVTAVLLLPNRGSQGPWVKELNGYILRASTLKKPADLRFDLVSKRLLSSDQLHPTPSGYSAMAQVFIQYLNKRLSKIEKAVRPDEDKNGIYDMFE